MNANTCSAFIGGPSLCRNGFPQNRACSGLGCPTCGHNSDVPACLRDDFHDKVFAAYFQDNGLPRFPKITIRAASHDTGGKDV